MLTRRIATFDEETSAAPGFGQSSDDILAPHWASEDALSGQDTEFSAGPDGFWAFSLAVYARPGVAPACLRLQDRDGLDVNMALFAVWAGGAEGELPMDGLARAMELSRIWRAEVVDPLRLARRALKAPEVPVDAAGAAALRTRVKADELQAEKLQQFMLAPIAETAAAPPGRGAAEANLAAYIGAAGLSTSDARSEETAADAVLLLDAAFGAEPG